MNILLTGATGMLGVDLAAALKGNPIYTPPRSQFNLSSTDFSYLENVLRLGKIEAIIHCAAFTDVDGCEVNDESWMVNLLATIKIADINKGKLPLYFISTDYVFDGKKRIYTEEDSTNPLSAYGKQKQLAEQYLLKFDNTRIIRTAWLFGHHSKCFPEKIIRMNNPPEPLKIVSDQIGSPTYTPHLAIAIKKMLELQAPPGIYHVVNAGAASWYEVAKELLPDANILPIKMSTYKKHLNGAIRPKHSVLDTSKINKLGIELPEWRTAIKEFKEKR